MKKNHYKEALRYASQYIDKVRIDYNLYWMERSRCPAYMVDDTINDIKDYMNEYADDHELPEDFWEEELDYEDDLIFDITEFYS